MVWLELRKLAVGARWWLLLPGVAILLSSGCVTKSAARAQAAAAYNAGRLQVLESMQQRQMQTQIQTQPQAQGQGQVQLQAQPQQLVVTILGEVQRGTIPWVEGLTLARALGEAQYVGQRDPRLIVLTRNGETVGMEGSSFLRGQQGDPPLLPGDVIELRP